MAMADSDPEKNYITPDGAKALQDELDFLWKEERPEVVKTVSWAASNGDRSENGDYIYGKKRLRQIDSRIRYLTKRIENIEILDNSGKESETVFFGAWVTIAKEDGSEKKFKIVGVDETKPEDGLISWKSPLAKAVLRKTLGDAVSVKTPQGEEEIEITSVSYS
jgi:transcription elongation factor GreB